MREAEQPVEIRAADMDAAVGKDVVLAVAGRGTLWRDPDDRKVRGAAAHVDNQRQFLARHALLVVECRGDRLELEGDVPKTLRAGRLLQLSLGRGVRVGIVVDELHRPPQHDGVDACPPTWLSSRFFRWPMNMPMMSVKATERDLRRVFSWTSELPSTLFSARISRPSTPSVYWPMALRPR